MPSVHFYNADKIFRFKKKQLLKQAIIDLFVIEKTTLNSINYVFCSDEYLLKINNDFLSHDYYTDVITFPISEKGCPVIGEVYISLERIKENAITNSSILINEILRVVFHGALHLCDHADKSKKEKALMRAKEAIYIEMFHVKFKQL